MIELVVVSGAQNLIVPTINITVERFFYSPVANFNANIQVDSVDKLNSDFAIDNVVKVNVDGTQIFLGYIECTKIKYSNQYNSMYVIELSGREKTRDVWDLSIEPTVLPLGTSITQLLNQASPSISINSNIGVISSSNKLNILPPNKISDIINTYFFKKKICMSSNFDGSILITANQKSAPINFEYKSLSTEYKICNDVSLVAQKYSAYSQTISDKTEQTTTSGSATNSYVPTRAKNYLLSVSSTTQECTDFAKWQMDYELADAFQFWVDFQGSAINNTIPKTGDLLKMIAENNVSENWLCYSIKYCQNLDMGAHTVLRLTKGDLFVR